MDKLIITESNRVKAKKSRKHLLVSEEMYNGVKGIADATDRSIYDVTQKLLQFALKNTVTSDSENPNNYTEQTDCPWK